MRYALFLFTMLLGCADPDINYQVKIIAVQQRVDSPYCVYKTEPIDEPVFEKGVFLDDCGKYAVGDIVTLTY
jgi:hypothetical protein